MPRNKTELLLTRDRLRLVLDTLQTELEGVEEELAALQGRTKLDEEFFRKYLVDLLWERIGKGASSSELLRILTKQGHKISAGSFRVFLSRYKRRGKLMFGKSDKDNWELSPETANEAAKQHSE